jgi:hypothetical protein
VVYDPVGGAMLSEALKVAAWGASYLVIGFAAGAIPKVPANLLLVKNITMHGIFWWVGGWVGGWGAQGVRQGVGCVWGGGGGSGGGRHALQLGSPDGAWCPPPSDTPLLG